MSEADLPSIPAPESSPAPTPADALSQVQRQVNTLLIAALVMSGTLTIFLLAQARYAKRDLELLQNPANQLIQQFKQEKPVMDNFLGRVAEFGKTHPDIMPLLQKYGVQAGTNAPTAPAPATAPIVPAKP